MIVAEFRRYWTKLCEKVDTIVPDTIIVMDSVASIALPQVESIKSSIKEQRRYATLFGAFNR